MPGVPLTAVTRPPADALRSVDRAREGALALATLALAVAAMHLAGAAAHLRAHPGAGAWVLGVGVAQVAWAIALIRMPAAGARLLRGGLAGAIVLVALWTVSRTSGLPFGLAPVQPLGLVDTLAAADTALIGGLAALVLWRGGAALAAASYAAVTLAVVSLSVLLAGGHQHAEARALPAATADAAFVCKLF